MGQVVQLEVSDSIVDYARKIADEHNTPLEAVLVEWLMLGMGVAPIEWLPDDQVLYLSNMMMPEDQQEEFSNLLYLNREGELTPSDVVRLDELMDQYRHRMVVKSQALVIAVKRGLRPRLDAEQEQET
jgi:hypothetical protein